jgi:hypothetical protein
VRTYYHLLGLADGVSSDEIKRAFRREIARYHPDKVQHLGIEFQDIAAVRASELTEAYRVLMDPAARREYDQSLSPPGAHQAPQVSPPGRPPSPAADDLAQRATVVEPEPIAPPPDGRFEKERVTTSHFIRRATLARVRQAVAALAPAAVPVPASEFELAFDIGGKGGLFRTAEAPLRLLAQFVGLTDAAAVALHWVRALKARKGSDPVCVLLLGAGGMAPARELSQAVADARRRTRIDGPIVVPVDVRDWEALFPTDTPPLVRALLQSLKERV